MASRYEELFNAMKAGEEPAKTRKLDATPKDIRGEKGPSKQSMQEAEDERMRRMEEKAPTTKSEMGKTFSKGGCCSASKRADGAAIRGKTRGRIV